MQRGCCCWPDEASAYCLYLLGKGFCLCVLTATAALPRCRRSVAGSYTWSKKPKVLVIGHVLTKRVEPLCASVAANHRFAVVRLLAHAEQLWLLFCHCRLDGPGPIPLWDAQPPPRPVFHGHSVNEAASAPSDKVRASDAPAGAHLAGCSGPHMYLFIRGLWMGARAFTCLA